MYCCYIRVLFDKEYNRTSIDNVYNRVLDLCRNNNIDLDLLNFLNEAYFFRQNDASRIDFNKLRNKYFFYILSLVMKGKLYKIKK